MKGFILQDISFFNVTNNCNTFDKKVIYIKCSASQSLVFGQIIGMHYMFSYFLN